MMGGGDWFDETLHQGEAKKGYTQRFLNTRTLCREHTGHQDLMIFETPAFGRVLALDGVVQTTEKDEFSYHEMLAHVPLFAHGDVSRVLIVGGGDGGTLREVLKHDVDRAVLVDIDHRVIELCAEHMPSLSEGAFNDPKAQVVIAEGVSYVAESQETFHAIIVDSTDPAGPGEGLFTERFYGACKALLEPGGVLVTQSGVPYFQGDEAKSTVRRLGANFTEAGLYLTAVPSYAGGFMALGFATDDAALKAVPFSALAGRFSRAAIKTRYYTPEIHKAAFALPPFIFGP